MLETRHIPPSIKSEYIACDLCGSSDLNVWDNARSNSLSICNGCGLVFTNPRVASPVDKDALIYDKAYFQQKSRMTKKLQQARQASYLKEKHKLESLAGDPGVILDVGCGMGFLLDALGERWEKHGCDVSSYALNEAKQKGISVYHGEFEKISFAEKKFDVIYFRASLHHAFSPGECIKKAFKLLKPNGIIAIVMSNNRDGLCGRLFKASVKSYEQAHNYLFSTKHLKMYLQKNGFNIVDTEYPYFQSGYDSMSDILSLPLTYIRFLKLKLSGGLNQEDNYDFSSPSFYKNYVNIYATRN